MRIDFFGIPILRKCLVHLAKVEMNTRFVRDHLRMGCQSCRQEKGECKLLEITIDYAHNVELSEDKCTRILWDAFIYGTKKTDGNSRRLIYSGSEKNDYLSDHNALRCAISIFINGHEGVHSRIQIQASEFSFVCEVNMLEYNSKVIHDHRAANRCVGT